MEHKKIIKTGIVFCGILVVFILQTNAQKKQVYMDGNLQEISRDDYFTNTSFEPFLRLSFETDSLIIFVKVNRIEEGNLPETTCNSLKTFLYTASGKSIKPNDIVLINYYPGMDDCNSTGDKLPFIKEYRRYIKKMSERKNIAQFNVFKSPEGIKLFGDINWIADTEKRVEVQFFPLHYPCRSFVIIYPDCSYYSWKGEYSPTQITGLLKEKKKL